MALKFYISVIKGSRLKVTKFQGLIPTFVEVTGETLAEGPYSHLHECDFQETSKVFLTIDKNASAHVRNTKCDSKFYLNDYHCKAFTFEKELFVSVRIQEQSSRVVP